MINRLKGLGNILYNVGNIPTSYQEALSYEEQLLWLLKYCSETIIPTVNECIDKVNGIQINFDEINEHIERIDESITTINATLGSLKAEIYENVDIKLQDQYNRVLQLMSDYQTIFDNRLSLMYDTLEEQIRQIEIGNVIAYDPTTGQYENINVVIQNIYDASRQNAINCNEFEALNLSCTQFESYDISAYNFDLNAKAILI